jgi:site-specific DNA recombinase
MPSTNDYGPKRAIVYVRVSTEEQSKSGYSIPDQLRELRAHAAREGYHVVEEAVDDGHSGADPHRPSLRRVMELAESGAIDVVLAKKRNRLFRSRLYHAAQGLG